MTNHEFMEEAEKKVSECWNKLNARHSTNFKTPSVSFDLRGRAAGMAGHGRIRLNLGFVKANARDMLEQTVPHEVVHSFLYAKGDPSHVRTDEDRQSFYKALSIGLKPRRTRLDPHGYTFMQNLAFLGCRQERTHSYALEDVVKGWKYRCPKCGKEFILSTRRHNQIRAGSRRFHTPCGAEYPLVRA